MSSFLIFYPLLRAVMLLYILPLFLCKLCVPVSPFRRGNIIRKWGLLGYIMFSKSKYNSRVGESSSSFDRGLKPCL